MFNSHKKKHFKNKIDVTLRKLYDVEFLVEQYKLTREGFRSEYDRLKELEDAANVRIAQEKEKEDPDKTLLDNLKKLKERYAPDMAALKKQMETIDLQIEGPSPVGSSSLNETMDNLKTVIGLLREKVAKL